MRAQIDPYAKQARWETLKAVATIGGAFLAGIAAMMAVILTVSHFMK